MRKFNRYDKPNKRSPDRFQRDKPRFSREDSPRFRARDSNRFEERDSERSFEKRMFSVTCARCGELAEVPFKPRENKPVYCSNCFRKNDNRDQKSSGPARNELDEINQKLDRIMEAMGLE